MRGGGTDVLRRLAAEWMGVAVAVAVVVLQDGKRGLDGIDGKMANVRYMFASYRIVP